MPNLPKNKPKKTLSLKACGLELKNERRLPFVVAKELLIPPNIPPPPPPLPPPDKTKKGV